MISLNNVSKSFGGRLLFDNVSFTIGTKERVGLVGRNGHGKTTLLNIIVGSESYDSGNIISPKGYKVGYLTQKIDFKLPSVREEAISVLPEDKKDMHYLAEKILFGLGFNSELMDLPPSKLSGGYQVRLNLAKLLISEPHMLLLDEPTNYLDIISVRWLRNFLIQWKGELIFVTHDRAFMDNVATHIAGIHRQKIRKIEGTTEKYYEQIALDEEVYEKTRLNDEAKRRDMEIYITRFRAKARMAGMVQSRIKTLAKMDKKDRLEALEELDFSFKYKDMPSQTALQAKNISFEYVKGEPLFEDLSFTLDKGDRLCIVGKNGAGKSTLLRVLSGKIASKKGEVLGHNYSVGGYLEQSNVQELNNEATIEDEIAEAGDFQLDRTKVRNICASMMFSGDDALKKIKILSGGEKCRVMLGKILAKPASYLLLDEPTNHLDMDASDSLLEAVNSFPGAVALVTHNETFLHTLANRLIVFQGEKPFLFEGTYAEFLEKVGWEEDEKVKKDKGLNKKNLRKQKAELIVEKGKTLKPFTENIERLESFIIENEEKISLLHQKIEEATSAQDGKLLAELGIELGYTQKEVDKAYSELNDVTVAYEKVLNEFDVKLKEYEDY